MATTTRPMTAEELFRMPDDGYRYELIKGELRRMTPSGGEHGEITINITVPLGQHIRTNGLGKVYAAETGFILAFDPDTVRAPDVAFLGNARAGQIALDAAYLLGAPDLAVEVVSPNDLYTEVHEKVIEWLDAGTSMVIVVDPRKRTATVYRSKSDVRILSEADTLDGADVVPGWSLPVRAIFE
jgi:Uma2 family endonuclease